MALGKQYLESLGLEIAKKKYYNAARVESVLEDFGLRAAALEREKAALKDEKVSLESEKAALENEKASLTSENASLRARADALACGREEIGDAILSAKVIAQQLIAEAREQAETILADAREQAARLTAEAKEKARELSSDRETREQTTLRAVQDAYLRLREECLGTAKLLDGEWQRFLCAFGDKAPEKEEAPAEAMPEDLADKLGEIAQRLGEIEADGEEEAPEA